MCVRWRVNHRNNNLFDDCSVWWLQQVRPTGVLFPGLFPNHFTADCHSPFRIQQVAKSFYARVYRQPRKTRIFTGHRTVIDHLTPRTEFPSIRTEFLILIEIQWSFLFGRVYLDRYVSLYLRFDGEGRCTVSFPMGMKKKGMFGVEILHIIERNGRKMQWNLYYSDC